MKNFENYYEDKFNDYYFISKHTRVHFCRMSRNGYYDEEYTESLYEDTGAFSIRFTDLY